MLESTAELHRAIYEAVQSRDFDRLHEIYHADCSYATGDGVERRGWMRFSLLSRRSPARFPTSM